MNIFKTAAVHPVWEAGFRPFFLMGTMSGILVIALWLADLSWSQIGLQHSIFWHAHEIIFGFSTAVVIGFLYTASQNWTKKRGIHGVPLMVAALLWLVGRLAFLQTFLDPLTVAIIDNLFLPYATFLLTPYLTQPDQRHNAGFLVMLALLWICNVVFHMGYGGWVPEATRLGLVSALQVLGLFIVVFAHRIIPFFSKNALQEFRGKRIAILEYAIAAGMTFVAVLMVWHESSPWLAFLALITAIGSFVRLGLWYDRRIWKVPILAILYVGYAWVGVVYILAACGAMGWVPKSAAIHAMGLGVVGTMTVGMMSRVSMGHTGRKIGSPKLILASYLLIGGASLVRALGVLFWPQGTPLLLQVAGTMWITSLVCLFLVLYPMLTQPRADGKTA